MKSKVLTQKEIASYQLALRCLRFMRRQRKCRSEYEQARELAKEIRAYRAEERRVN